jgi:hypothetical protein
MRRVLLVLPLFFAVVLVAPAAPAHACSCALLGTAQKVAGADVILRGAVTRTDDPGGGSSSRLVTHEVAVKDVYRDTAAATSQVRSPAGGGSCGIEVQQGREYVIFARRVGSELRAELCGGTAPASAELVAEVERLTGPGRPPHGATTSTSAPATPGPERSSAAVPVGLGLGGALVASALAVLGWRRRRGVAA